MFDITLYLGRFKKLVADNQETKDAIKEVLSSVLGVSFSDSQIIFKGKSIRIKAEPAIKSLLFIKKKQLLEALKNNPKTNFVEQID